MADLQLSSAVLDELIAAFTGFGRRVSSACAEIRSGDAALTGDDPLAGQVRDFGGSWNYGLTQLGQHSGVCVTELRQIGSTFDKLDEQLSKEIKLGPPTENKR